MDKEIIIGKNAVLEALRAKRAINSILVAESVKRESFLKIILMAKDFKIPIKTVNLKKLDVLSQNNKHQGIIAFAALKEYSSLEEIFKKARDKEEFPFIIIADRKEDPHNLGAIIRTAECAGAHGLLISSRKSAGVNFTVEKTSAGAVEHLLIARYSNLCIIIEDLKKHGLWVYGTDIQGQTWCKADLKGPIALIIGNEGEGMSRLAKEKCDVLLSLPMHGKIQSLNASVAAGIFLYEIVRQRFS
jgi:23S rRNA (guanosine2251-2'-O)-methyltransferase